MTQDFFHDRVGELLAYNNSLWTEEFPCYVFQSCGCNIQGIYS
jgi:hypothetical protein